MEGIPRENPPNFLPQMTRKGYGRDSQGRIRPTSFLGQPERVMEMIPRENPPDFLPRTTQKRYGRDTQGRNPSIGGFRRIRIGIRIRIRMW
jgi:hypothetical protein